MTNLSRLTLAAVLLGGMALPAVAQTAGVQGASPAVHAKLHRHTHQAAATDAAMPKEPVTKTAPVSKDAPVVSKDAPVVSKDAPVVSKDAPVVSKDAPVVSKDAPLSKGAPKTAETLTPAPTVKPAVPGQTVQAPTTAPKVN